MKTIINIHQAKTHFSSLVERALKGEEIIIARAGKSAVKLTPMPQREAWLGMDESKGKIFREFWRAHEE